MQEKNLFAENGKTQSYALALDRLERTVLKQNELITELKTWVQQLSSKMQGDVIESGGVKNVNINYFDSKHASAPTQPETANIPSQLKQPLARQLRRNLIRAGMIDKNWQPQNLSGTESSLLAKALSDRLGITDVWQTFSPLWNRKPDSLRRAFYKALDQKKSLTFQDRLKEIMG